MLKFINQPNFGLDWTYDNSDPSAPVSDRIKWKFRPVSRAVFQKSFYVECVNTAKHIRQNTDRDIVVCLSGGIDSEVTCKSFLDANIPFTALTMVHKKGTNDEEVGFAERFCKEYGVKQIFVELDVEDFFTNGIRQWIDRGYRSHKLFRYIQLWLIEYVNNMGGCAVIGSGEQYYFAVREWVKIYFDNPKILALQWCQENNVVHFPYFFNTTPEIIASYVNDAMVTRVTSLPTYMRTMNSGNASHWLKIMILYHYFPDMERRVKRTGFENVPNVYELEDKLAKEFKEIGSVGMSLQEMRQQLYSTGWASQAEMGYVQQKL